MIVWDIDGTLTDSSGREHLIEQSWDAFHGAAYADLPIQPIVDLLISLHAMDLSMMIGVTGRPEKWRSSTLAWLVKHSLPIDVLLMRPDDDYRPAPEVKRDLITRYCAPAAPADVIRLAIEDSAPNVEMFKGLGIVTLQVHTPHGKGIA